MALTDKEEEILETFWTELIEHKKDSCGAGLFKNDEAVRDLEKAGYLKVKDDMIYLTPRGREEAKNCARRHRLAERLLVDVLDVRGRTVHGASCKFEHLLHEGLDESVCTLLGHPKACPHGRPIPRGKCCMAAMKIPARMIMPLSEIDAGARAKILYLETSDHGALQKIIAMGAIPKSELKLLQKFPSYVFQIGKSQFAIDKELASMIYVQLFRGV